MSARRFLICAAVVLLFANVASAARYQKCKDGKTLVWNNLRGVAQEATWSGLRDVNGYATGPGTLIWYRLNDVVNAYTGKMIHGKFEGVVVKEQSGTRLQANFTNGEKTGDWSEPGSEETRAQTPAPTATPRPSLATSTPKPAQTPKIEEPVEEQLLPTPIPSRTPIVTRSPTATATPRPTITPTPTPIPTPVPTPLQTPTPLPTRTPLPTAVATATPLQTRTPPPPPISTPTITVPRAVTTPTAMPSITPPVLRSLSPTPAAPSASIGSGSQGLSLAPSRNAFALGSPSPTQKSPLGEEPSVQVAPKTSSPTATPESSSNKAEMIADFKKQTASVLAQVRDATSKFREVDRIDLSPMPAAVSGSISSLADASRAFRAKLGYEVAYYECGSETATVDALVAIDQVIHELNDKNAPAGRLLIINFFKRYPATTSDAQKPVWRYLASILAACNKAKKDAEDHLAKAKAFETAGKPGEALTEYRAIYKVYPNAITADKIRLLENPPK